MAASLRERIANAHSALTDSPRRAGNYRLLSIDDSTVGFLLRGSRGPHSMIVFSAEQARKLARAIREVVAMGPGGGDRRVEGFHERDLTARERAANVWAQLAGRPRWANLWLVRYLTLPSGTEMVQIELGTTMERNAHSMLPVTLPMAVALADELEGRTAAGATQAPSGRRSIRASSR